MVILSEGDRVPADGIVRRAQDLLADESLLTGESVPVRKAVGSGVVEAASKPGGEDSPFVYSGSLIVRGSALVELVATGPRSEIGKIGRSLSELERESPRLRAQTERLVMIFAWVGAAVSVTAILLYGLLRGDWLDAFLAGVALGMSLLPEEFPVVLTVFMAMGAWRISRAQVLTRRASAIESLGAATVLCTDKTGTLTENRMVIAQMRLPDGRRFDSDAALAEGVPDEFHDLVRLGVLASVEEPFDPMEKAFHHFAQAHVYGAGAPAHVGLSLVHAYGLRPNLLAVTHVWEAPEAEDFIVAAKGAPEAIGRLCGLPEQDSASLRASADAMAAAGLRVLGVARAKAGRSDLPHAPDAFSFEFLGLVGLEDPLRPSVPQAVRDCRSAGVRVVMITGDYPATALAIAERAGIDAQKFLTGEQLETASEPELAHWVKDVTVFARIMPEQKLRIVNALKANGEIVAMTGDGVNDAPSLKAAHIGVAMGGRGADVAREASSIVLLDDDFGSIVKAVRLGRRIYDNLRKATAFIFAIHLPIAGMALLPLILGWPIILGPVHIAFLEMVIDPVCTLVFEAEREEEDVMRRPPRRPDDPMFPARLVEWSVLQGLAAFLFTAVVFGGAMHAQLPTEEVRAITFFALLIAIVALIFVNRSYSASIFSALTRSNRALFAVLGVVTLMASVTLYAAPARAIFDFAPLPLHDLVPILVSGLAILLVLEAVKKIWSRGRLFA